ncbi:FKBP-type peptidyl-prolyl cis-trans isomerase [soil metagenome]
MKKTIVLGFGCLLALGAMAQTKPAAKSPVKPAAKPVAATPAKIVLKNSLDSLSYAIGVLDASFFKQQGIEKLNYSIMSQAVQAVIEGREPIMTAQVADQTLRSKMQEASMKKIEPAVAAGKKFCAENKRRPEVKETASGLQYEVITLGTGPMPKDTNTVKVHYTGTLLNGTKFDSSRDRGEPAEFPLNGVIPGWTEGVQLMPVGSKFKFYIPYNLAYGTQGSPPAIPGGATLVFDVELLEIVK